MRVHRFAQQVRLVADVQLDVVAGRLDPVDLLGAHEVDPAARLDDEAVDLVRRLLQILDEREQAALEVARGVVIRRAAVRG